ncbi:VOC family protein [Alkalicoccobacillus gibsonii]|uniref:VOC family protein n=1 Tax=Alkalicoccobacillus gibsonii TaxID=79881 RepID=UPI0019329441|nr:VOC family protein [Alkalicoccobacillus gibsonii]MBM0066344.1 VOC family protein [Alkalicoccobacillus gibsonii]
MRIEHVAIWVKDLEKMRSFYCEMFQAVSNEKYINAKKGFESYFLTFESGARLELMKKQDIDQGQSNKRIGYAHIAFSLNSKNKVDCTTEVLSDYGCKHIDGPRVTGDGYYESVLLDPEGNTIELTI